MEFNGIVLDIESVQHLREETLACSVIELAVCGRLAREDEADVRRKSVWWGG